MVSSSLIYFQSLLGKFSKFLWYLKRLFYTENMRQIHLEIFRLNWFVITYFKNYLLLKWEKLEAKEYVKYSHVFSCK